MQKLLIVLVSSSIAIVSLLFVAGCQPAPGIELEPSPAPAPETEVPTPPATEPEPEPLPPDQSEPEEAAEPIAHSSAYIKFDGIDGESQNTGHEGWSEIVSFEQWIHRPESGATGTARRRGDVILEDIVLVKQLDKASP